MPGGIIQVEIDDLGRLHMTGSVAGVSKGIFMDDLLKELTALANKCLWSNQHNQSSLHYDNAPSPRVDTVCYAIRVVEFFLAVRVGMVWLKDCSNYKLYVKTFRSLSERSSFIFGNVVEGIDQDSF